MMIVKVKVNKLMIKIMMKNKKMKMKKTKKVNKKIVIAKDLNAYPLKYILQE